MSSSSIPGSPFLLLLSLEMAASSVNLKFSYSTLYRVSDVTYLLESSFFLKPLYSFTASSAIARKSAGRT